MFAPDFEIVHLGVNTGTEEEAVACAAMFETLFSLPVNPAKESADARFTGTQIEWMKKPGRIGRSAKPYQVRPRNLKFPRAFFCARSKQIGEMRNE